MGTGRIDASTRTDSSGHTDSSTSASSSSPSGSSRRTSGPPTLITNLLLSLAVTVVLVSGLEAIARFIESRHPPPTVADYIWDWEKKWEGDFYTIRSDGVGWPPWEEFNGDGLRDRTHSLEKPEGTWRVVFLGDSVTLGAGIRPEEAYPQVLEARLREEGRRLEVFGVALWGWSTRQQRIAYERLARKYKPDQVVLAVCLNDIPELQNNLARPPRVLSALHERSALVRLLVGAQRREIASVEELFLQKHSAKVRQGLARFFAEVRALREEVQADHATLALIVLPFRFQVRPDSPPPTVQADIAGFCGAEGLRCLDLLPALRAAGEEAFLDYDHLSAAGARRVAEEIGKSGLLPQLPSDRELLIEVLKGQRASQATPWLERRPGAEGEKAAPVFVDALQHQDPRVRSAAAWALEHTPINEAAARALVTVLHRDESESVRASAARALGTAKAPGQAAVAALFQALDDGRQSVRWEAARSLSRLELSPGGTVPLLSAALESRDSYVRGFAAWKLGAMGEAAKDAVPALIRALGEEEGYGRAGAASALAKMGSLAKEAVPALLEGLKSADGDRRWKAARALGRIGTAARDAVPALVEALRDPNEYVRAQAARALGRIDPHDRTVVAALSRAAKDPDEAVRREAAEALGRTGGD